ncbi:MAG: small ribosomal subunit Rsm22 family protein [Salinigranum sp.]
MIDREAVRSNAKYLRNVRPVDPEEICEYVEGTPHPAVVRRVLREEAFDLGLVERRDGAFVPVADDPVRPPGWSPDGLPDAYAFALEDLLVERFGREWHRGESGDRLREAIRRLKADYYYQNPVAYDETAALGYAIYHLPDFYATVGYVLDDVAERGLLPRRLRVLDVGAGVGGPALGLHDYLRGSPAADDGSSDDRAGDASKKDAAGKDTSGEDAADAPTPLLVDYHAVEPSTAADVLERLLGETGRNFHATIHRERAESFAPEGEYDIVLFANVLSELDDPVAVVERYREALADDGSIVLLAPADRNTSTGLRDVERAVAPADGDVTVYSPTLRLWPGYAPEDRGWSFDVRPDVGAPAVQRKLDEAGDDPGTFVHTSVQFSYAVLRTDGRRRVDVLADPDRHARMAEMGRHVTERVDLLAVKLSRNLAGDGNPVFKVSDGSERVGHFAVLAGRTGLNRALADADYGDVLAVENVLVLWNDDEEAYNLVVDTETYVDRVA